MRPSYCERKCCFSRELLGNTRNCVAQIAMVVRVHALFEASQELSVIYYLPDLIKPKSDS